MRLSLQFLFFLQVVYLPAFAQSSQLQSIDIRTSAGVYSSERHVIRIENESFLWFAYHNDQEVAELTIRSGSTAQTDSLLLMPSADYEILEPLVFYESAWKGKIRFTSLTRAEFLKLQIRILKPEPINEMIRLIAVTQTTLQVRPPADDLYVGEERMLELFSNKPENLRLGSEWSSNQSVDYKLEKRNDQVWIRLMPNKPGELQLHLNVALVRPWFNEETGLLQSSLPVNIPLNIRSSRLKFLAVDKREVTLDDLSRTKGIDIQLDSNREIELNKTYRLENQEASGGHLVAEIYTRSLLPGNRVLATLRAYNYHRSGDGMLYLKAGDEPVAVTNLSITPVPVVSRVWIMHDGGDWTQDLTIYPGETVSLRVEGTALHKTRLHVEELENLATDSLTGNEFEVPMRCRIPLNMGKKRLSLYNYQSPTGFSFQVREFEVPRPFDYVMLNYGDINRVVSQLHGPVLYERTIRDVVISFNTDKIDSDNRLYGKQYLSIDVRVTGPASELIDMRSIPAIVCPSDRSPRYSHYDRRNCSGGEISLNKYLRRSTNDLDDWSRIQISFRSTSDKSGVEPQQKDIEIILKKRYKFDIDVSFPAGLVTVASSSDDPGTTSFSNLYGISMAMIAQFAFYHPEKIAKLRPYRIGAGFLALDAFNFQSDRQDLAMVALASLYPTTRDKKLAFPLYIGGGYQFKASKWMLLIGPGISVKL